MTQTYLEVHNLCKTFTAKNGSVEALKGVSLSIGKGEIFGVIGLSGAGKSTLVRCMNLLERPDSGDVLLNGESLLKLSKEQLRLRRQKIGMIFQHFNLLEQQTVLENVCFPLEIRGIPRKERREKALELLEKVGLADKANAYPAQLSGGQKQRVAIARALVNRPRVLLLDEPLGALDLQLRRQMQLELKALQQQLGITFIYITHDQEEALTMSDRIAVMRDGQFVQIGTPAQVYDEPRTSFVARFVGSANILQGTVVAAEGGLVTARVAGCPVCARAGQTEFLPGQPIALALRSEQVDFAPEGSGIPAVVKEKSFAGGMLRIALELPDGSRLVASRHGIDQSLAPGQKLCVRCAPEAAVPVEVDD